MRIIDVKFNSEQDKIDFVNHCEHDFEKRLNEASAKIIKNGTLNILLSGPT